MLFKFLGRTPPLTLRLHCFQHDIICRCFCLQTILVISNSGHASLTCIGPVSSITYTRRLLRESVQCLRFLFLHVVYQLRSDNYYLTMHQSLTCGTGKGMWSGLFTKPCVRTHHNIAPMICGTNVDRMIQADLVSQHVCDHCVHKADVAKRTKDDFLKSGIWLEEFDPN